MQKSSFKGYRLDFDNAALKDLKKLDIVISKKIVKKLEDLVAGKENVDFKKMETQDDITYRLRYGNYRAICEIHKHIITVLVVAVGPRKEIYRKY